AQPTAQSTAPLAVQPTQAPRPTKRYGEAPRSHREALLHQLDARFQRRADKGRQVELPLADSSHWKRVRFTGIDHLTGFVYGEDRHMLTSAFAFQLEPGEKPSTALCMERFERDGLARFRKAKGTFTPIVETEGKWRKNPLLIHKADGRLTFFFSRYEFSAAWAAYPAYRDGCLVYATVVFWEDEEELARQVRDHWVEQAFGSLRTRSDEVPQRR
ncbi:MAG TPA: hypothetical protein VLC09_19610, partial [Polyangiaceae bacterium]|nr:hypothetical protein [Polyangiaceae bacterium]